MADTSDVEQVLVNVITGILYPNGTGQTLPTDAPLPSTLGAPCKIRRGWPLPNSLDKDIAKGVVTVTVYPDPGMDHNTSRYLDNEQQASPVTPPTITAAVASGVVTFAGSAGVQQLAGIWANGRPYAYVAGPSETPAAVAAALGALVPKATVAGPAVTVPDAPDLAANVVGYGTSIIEEEREEQGFRVVFWCPTKILRDAAPKLVRPILAAMTFLDLPDMSVGRLKYQSSYRPEPDEKAAIWRRDIVYTVDFPTTTVALQPTLLFGQMTMLPKGGPSNFYLTT